MKRFLLLPPLLFVVLMLSVSLSFNSEVSAQSTITFNINLKPQLMDSSFVPGRDQLEIVGNLYPLTTGRRFYLADHEPIDSVYSVTIDFSPRVLDQMLTYNYEMTANFVKQTENLPRNLRLLNKKIELDPLFFNAFAW